MAGVCLHYLVTASLSRKHFTARRQQSLQISLASVFPGGVHAALTAAHPGGTIDIDLFPVKQAISEALQ
jgi:hypothetical protein